MQPAVKDIRIFPRYKGIKVGPLPVYISRVLHGASKTEEAGGATLSACWRKTGIFVTLRPVKDSSPYTNTHPVTRILPHANRFVLLPWITSRAEHGQWLIHEWSCN